MQDCVLKLAARLQSSQIRCIELHGAVYGQRTARTQEIRTSLPQNSANAVNRHTTRINLQVVDQTETGNDHIGNVASDDAFPTQFCGAERGLLARGQATREHDLNIEERRWGRIVIRDRGGGTRLSQLHIGGVAQHDRKGFIILVNRVADDRHQNGLTGHAGSKRERAADRLVIQAGGGRSVLSREIDRHGARRRERQIHDKRSIARPAVSFGRNREQTHDGHRLFDAGQEVIACAAVEIVCIAATNQRVIARLTREHVIPKAAIQRIVAGSAELRVVVVSAIQLIVPRLAIEHIVARTAGDDVIVRASLERVIAVTTVDVVVAPLAIDRVVAGSAQQTVSELAAED